jgi:pentatricopeptide repeat protein
VLTTLELLAKDGKAQYRNMLQASPSSSGHLEMVAAVEPLNNVLADWKADFLRMPEKSVHPRQILEKVDDLKASKSIARPDYRSYCMILEAATGVIGRSNQLSDIQFVDSFFDRLLEEAKTDFDVRPTSNSFAMVMEAWVRFSESNSGSGYKIDAPGKIEAWIDRMTHLSEQGWPDMVPNVVVYNILLNAYAKSGNVKMTEQTLQKMMQGEINGVSPDTISYTTLLSAYAHAATPDSATSAATLLTQMLELYENGFESAKPNVVSFTNVIHCYSRLGMGDKAVDWLRRLEALFLETNDADLKPDLYTYNVVLMSKMNNPERAEDFLRHILQERRNWVRPNARSFNIVMSAWAKRGEAERAECILQQMHDHYVSGELETNPDVVAYNTLLDAWANKIKTTSSTRQQKDRKMITFAWDRSSAILRHMEDLYNAGNNGVKPNTRTWNIMINVCAKAGKIDEAERMLTRFSEISTEDDAPTVLTWNTLLSACLNTGDVRRANIFWNRMKTAGILPDIVSYNTLISCYAQSNPNEGQRLNNANGNNEADAFAIFRELQRNSRVKPNRVTYLSMINFLIRRGRLEAAGSFLLGIAEQYDTNNDTLPPDRDLFHKILVAWAQYGAPKKAEALFLKMSEFEDRPGLKLRPTVDTYNRVINCWAKSMRPESGERADFILREMEALSSTGDRDVSPDMCTYNTVLDAWANSRDPTAATRTGNLILEMILKGDPELMPDSVSYGTWLKIISLNHVTDKKLRVKDVLKTMKIHNFAPTEYLLDRIKTLASPVDL